MSMSMKRTVLSTAMLSVLGLTAVSTTASATVIPDGTYEMVIKTTPVVTDTYGYTAYKFGKDGAWNSSFTFGGSTPTASSSQSMTDNGDSVASNGGRRGSSVGGDAYAGKLTIVVSGGTFTVTSFQVDLIYNTAGGNFVQYAPSTAGMTGTIDQTTGDMTLTPTGRLGAISSFPALYDESWNVDDCDMTVVCADNGNTNWNTFSTISASNGSPGFSNTKTIHGAPATSIGDTNSDGLSDFQAILVTGSFVGSEWGGFFGAQVFEAWNVNLLSIAPPTAADDTASVIEGDTVNINVVDNDTGTYPLDVISVSPTTNGGEVTYTNCTKTSSSASTCDLNYDPNGLAGPATDTFTYTVEDTNGSATATVIVTIVPIGSPSSNGDEATTDQNAPVNIDVVANDTDEEDTGGLPLGVVALGATNAPTKGTCTANNPGQTITYTPNDGEIGTDTCTYTVADGDGNVSAEATVTITINPAALVDSGTFETGDLEDADGQVTLDQLTAAGIPADDANDDASNLGVITQCLGGCYDFTVTGVTSPVNVVLLPLTTPIADTDIADGVRYRKYINGAWQNFDISAGDAVASATLTAGGGCPAPGDAAWKPWTNGTDAVADATHVGDRCIQLTIADDGPNDSNATAGTISDPSGAGVGTQEVDVLKPRSEVLNDFGSGGCSISATTVDPLARGDWWLIAGFLAWLGAVVRRKRMS